ncbi:Hsp20/alpha crystallin family protein [Oceanobacillus piezotolerans]|uniref:Hsp20/alpha crystallin family protein n=2 Tax=Oceanobacillus piezotolerans TaxID=2448030 RepID=A0A498DKX5_9BACI|nr:Hsp20/alpha crystallin family protein [Oceanobacillus piezotolerans]
MQPLHDFMKRMDNAFNDSFKHLQHHFHTKPFRVEMEEKDHAYIVKAELPGYSREQVKLEIIGNQIRIAAKDSSSLEGKDEKNNQYTKQESYEIRERYITLPMTIPEDKTTATFRHGLLKITIPKEEENRKNIVIE